MSVVKMYWRMRKYLRSSVIWIMSQVCLLCACSSIYLYVFRVCVGGGVGVWSSEACSIHKIDVYVEGSLVCACTL